MSMAKHLRPKHNKPRGITLIIVLILLAVLSLLTSVSIRGSSSNEEISNQSRLRALALQAAEAGLRYCENNVQQNALNNSKGFAPTAAPASGTTYDWETLSHWDAVTAPSYLRTPATYSAAGDTNGRAYFARRPECMSQYLTINDPKVVLTTARGLGPDVPSGKNGSPPDGTEVWLQSVMTLN